MSYHDPASLHVSPSPCSTAPQGSAAAAGHAEPAAPAGHFLDHFTRAVTDVLALRAHQHALGHTIAADCAAPDCWLENVAHRYLYRAQLTRKGAHSAAAARADYLRAAAALIAAVDRIDALASHQPGQENPDAT